MTDSSHTRGYRLDLNILGCTGPNRITSGVLTGFLCSGGVWKGTTTSITLAPGSDVVLAYPTSTTTVPHPVTVTIIADPLQMQWQSSDLAHTTTGTQQSSPTKTSATITSPGGSGEGLSQSDKIQIGVGVGVGLIIGIPTIILGILALRRKNIVWRNDPQSALMASAIPAQAPAPSQPQAHPVSLL